MIKASALSIIVFSFVFLVACANNTPTPPQTMDPSAIPLITTLAFYAETLDGIEKSATSYSYTATPTPTPTKTPNREAVIKQIRDSIDKQLISHFEADIRLRDVKFGPLEGKELTYLYIEIDCEGKNNNNCPKNQVIIAVVDACQEKPKKLLENIPKSTDMLTITIFDSKMSQTWVVDVKWDDVLNYINGDLASDEFISQISYSQFK